MEADIDQLFGRLSRSRFRSRFSLGEGDHQYIQSRGWERVRSHAFDFVNQRLAPARPENEGRQTPMKGHPVFIAQHATATCCRGCLSKWHGIPPGKELDGDQVKKLVAVIHHWLERQMEGSE